MVTYLSIKSVGHQLIAYYRIRNKKTVFTMTFPASTNFLAIVSAISEN